MSLIRVWVGVCLAAACAGICWAQVAAGDEGGSRKGFALLRAGDVAGATSEFLAAIKANAKDISAHVGLAQAYAATGRHEEAVAEHRVAVGLNPLSSDLHLGLASALAQVGIDAESEAHYRRASQLAPGNPRPLLALGDALRSKGRLERARAAYLHALGLAPDNPAALQALGSVASDREDWSEAAESFAAMVQLLPEARPARLLLINALSNGERHADALRESDALLKLAPDDPDACMARASALGGLERYDEAIGAYTALLARSPQLATGWGNLGWTQYLAGRYDDAITSSRRALEIDNKLAYVRFNLGLIYCLKDDAAQAEKEYRDAGTVADVSDIRAALKDVDSALKKHPDSKALALSRELLSNMIATRGRS